MDIFRSLWVWLQGKLQRRLRRRQVNVLAEKLAYGSVFPKKITNPTPFTSYAGHFTTKPKVAYTVFAHGSLPRNRGKTNHYLRIRPYLGTRDPAISAGVPNRKRFARIVLATSISPENRVLWLAFFNNPPTHVVRLGFVYSNGVAQDILYIPVSFSFANHASSSIALSVGKRLIEQLEKERSPMLCPSPEKMGGVQMFWIGMIFLNWRWLVSDRYHLE